MMRYLTTAKHELERIRRIQGYGQPVVRPPVQAEQRQHGRSGREQHQAERQRCSRAPWPCPGPRSGTGSPPS